MKHSELPQPILFKDIVKDQDLAELKKFIDRYSKRASRFTVTDDGVGRGLVCAFLQAGDPIQGIMLYSNKETIKNYFYQQGYYNSNNTVMTCWKMNTSKL